MLCTGVVYAAAKKGEKNMIQAGSTVTMDYTLTVDGQVEDSSQGKEPLTFVMGEGKIIPGLERQLEGLTQGDTRTITVSPDEGYGQRNPEAVKEIDKSAFKDASAMKVGQVVTAHSQSGHTYHGIITDVRDKTVMVDFNHPLAGKELKFDVKIVDVK